MCSMGSPTFSLTFEAPATAIASSAQPRATLGRLFLLRSPWSGVSLSSGPTKSPQQLEAMLYSL
jgi:hypothetical protein